MGATSGRNRSLPRDITGLKKIYLFGYNSILFALFLKVNVLLISKTLKGTVDDRTVQHAAHIVKLLTYTQILESVHPMVGLVPGGPLMPFTQIIGRLIVNHFLTNQTIRLDSSPFVHYLFIVWSSIEIFRYSLYALRVFKIEAYPLTWCRYTLFMPLYPMGGFCEAMIVLKTANYYEKIGAFSIELPNSLNISFSLPLALRVYSFVFLGPTIYFLWMYMLTQRRKQLKSKSYTD